MGPARPVRPAAPSNAGFPNPVAISTDTPSPEPAAHRARAEAEETLLTDLNARFERFFNRPEVRAQARAYLRLLLTQKRDHPAARGETSDRSKRQRFLNQASWDEEGVRDELGRYLIEHLTGEPHIVVLNEVPFIKSGRASVGAEWQQPHPLLKRINCQLGLFLTYVSPRGAAPVDRRLYLPESWCADMASRAATEVPESIAFESKATLGLAMVQHAWEGGMPIQWVASEMPWANTPDLCHAITRMGLHSLLAIPNNQHVRIIKAPDDGERSGSVVKPVRESARPGSPIAPSRPAVAVASQWPEALWRCLAAGDAEEWARGRVADDREPQEGETVWLLAHRRVGRISLIRCYLSDAPQDTPLTMLATVACSYGRADQCLQAARKQAGLAAYKVRHWTGRHRHITCSMLAYGLRVATRQE